MSRFEKIPLIATAFVGMWLGACAPVGSDWLMESISSAVAKNQIMLVETEPSSFGYLRLKTHCETFPELALFVTRHGVPDFLAETGTSDHRYLILYYLKVRHAFACHSRPGNSREVEFAGPYPITEREFHLLDGFKRDPERHPLKR